MKSNKEFWLQIVLVFVVSLASFGNDASGQACTDISGTIFCNAKIMGVEIVGGDASRVMMGDGHTEAMTAIIPSQTGNAGRTLTTNGTAVSWGKRQETYSGVTNASGVYTVTFATAYGAAPNIQANIVNQSSTNQFVRISSIATTGFTINVFQRNSINLLGTDVLLFSTANTSGASVDVLITEK